MSYCLNSSNQVDKEYYVKKFVLPYKGRQKYIFKWLQIFLVIFLLKSFYYLWFTETEKGLQDSKVVATPVSEVETEVLICGSYPFTYGTVLSRVISLSRNSRP